MTPKFSQAVDAVLLEVFDLLERIDAGDTVFPSECRGNIEGKLSKADGLLFDGGSKGDDLPWGHLAKYALVSWIDEMLVKAHRWSGQDFWRHRVLEREFFNSRNCHEEYYVRAKRANDRASRDVAVTSGDSAAQQGRGIAYLDAVEMFYVCVLLGFRGLYEDTQESGSRQSIERHGLRADLHAWATEFADSIQRLRSMQQLPAGGDVDRGEIQPAGRTPALSTVVWPWLATGLGVTLIVLVCLLDKF